MAEARGCPYLKADRTAGSQNQSQVYKHHQRNISTRCERQNHGEDESDWMRCFAPSGNFVTSIELSHPPDELIFYINQQEVWRYRDREEIHTFCYCTGSSEQCFPLLLHKNDDGANTIAALPVFGTDSVVMDIRVNQMPRRFEATFMVQARPEAKCFTMMQGYGQHTIPYISPVQNEDLRHALSGVSSSDKKAIWEHWQRTAPGDYPQCVFDLFENDMDSPTFQLPMQQNIMVCQRPDPRASDSCAYFIDMMHASPMVYCAFLRLRVETR